MNAPTALDQRIATWADFVKALEDGSIEYRPLASALRPIVDELPGVGRQGQRG